MKLFLFPESSSLSNGYGIVVNQDYKLYNPGDSDLVVWYTNETDNPLHEQNDITLKRYKTISIKRLGNMLSKRFGSEVYTGDLMFLKDKKFDHIFCGDVIFYRALRKVFAHDKIAVRFHNCFSRIYFRNKILAIPLDIKFKMDLLSMTDLETQIFNDVKVHKIFLSEEDMIFYRLMTGSNDCEVAGLNIDLEKAKTNRSDLKFNNKLIWIGGVQAHKKRSLEWFINIVYQEIKKKIPDCELHLWGYNTQNFDNPSGKIYGYGFSEGNEFPYKGPGLFINPDIIGGGVKVKVKNLIEEGLPFISTPFGFEGYSYDLANNNYCIIANPEDWSETIVELLKTYP